MAGGSIILSIKLIGAVFIVAGCILSGSAFSFSYKKEEKLLYDLAHALDYMSCDLEYRMSPLSDLCKKTSQQCDGVICDVFANLSAELEQQIAPDAKRCMDAVLDKTHNIPSSCKTILQELGVSLGQFGIDGQLRGLENVRNMCNMKALSFTQNKDSKIRTYQTLGICGGAAITILLI